MSKKRRKYHKRFHNALYSKGVSCKKSPEPLQRGQACIKRMVTLKNTVLQRLKLFFRGFGHICRNIIFLGTLKNCRKYGTRVYNALRGRRVFCENSLIKLLQTGQLYLISMAALRDTVLRHVKINFEDFHRTYRERKRVIARFAVAFCLCGVLVLNFVLPSAGSGGVSAAQVQGPGAAQTGVGGGGYPEKVSLEGQTDALEMGMLEPESFSKPQMLLFSSYTIKKDDMIGDLATAFGLNEDTIISINGIKNTRLIQIGQVLRVPNQDGIFYTVKNDDTLETIAQKYSSDVTAIQLANELFSDKARSGTVLFIPGAQLDWTERQEINGDLFIWPAAGYITSPYGYRRWPFGGGNVRQFHSGLDIGAPMGSPVRAAMSGRVSAVGWDDVLGNYAVVSHHSGYRTMYGHMSTVRVKSGAYVGTGERIGDVGSTGMSTGPHLHFTVYKNGVTVNPRSLMK
jgi:murein DD-endopeptidase MepM/ murein hydrolase activator NlpD